MEEYEMFNIFKKKPKAVSKRNKKLAIVVCHNQKAQGAVRVDNNQTEFSYYTEISNYCLEFAKQHDLDVKIFYRQNTTGYAKEIRECYEDVDEWGADVSCEAHFNASGTKSARGCEVLSSGSPASLKISTAVYNELIRVFNFKGRGVKVLNKKSRGYLSVTSAKCPSILPEPFFGSSAKDCRDTSSIEDKKALAHCFLAGIKKGLE